MATNQIDPLVIFKVFLVVIVMAVLSPVLHIVTNVNIVFQ